MEGDIQFEVEEESLNTQKRINQEKKLMIFLMKALNFTGMLLSNYITLLATGMGYSAKTASLMVSASGIAYPFISFFTGIMSDRYKRTHVLIISKCFSIVAIILAMCAHTNSVIIMMLILVACVENGIEPIFYAIVTDQCDEHNRVSLFSVLQLGGNVGLAVSSLISTLMLQVNIHCFVILLLCVSISCCISISCFGKTTKEWMKGKRNESESSELRETSTKHERSIQNVFKYLRGEKVLLIFSAIQIFYSIVSVQINYGLALKVHNDFDANYEIVFGTLLATYYVTMILINFCITNLKKNYSAIGCMVVSGVFFVIAMYLMTFCKQVSVLCVGMMFWAVAQLLFKLYNGVFVSEKCDSKYIGAVTSFLPNIASAGIVIGPLLGGVIYNAWGIKMMWGSLLGFAVIGTVFMTVLYIVEKNYFKEKSKK